MQSQRTGVNKPFSFQLLFQVNIFNSPDLAQLNSTTHKINYVSLRRRFGRRRRRYIMLFNACGTFQWFIDWMPEVKLAPENRRERRKENFLCFVRKSGDVFKHDEVLLL